MQARVPWNPYTSPRAAPSLLTPPPPPPLPLAPWMRPGAAAADQHQQNQPQPRSQPAAAAASSPPAAAAAASSTSPPDSLLSAHASATLTPKPSPAPSAANRDAISTMPQPQPDLTLAIDSPLQIRTHNQQAMQDEEQKGDDASMDCDESQQAHALDASAPHALALLELSLTIERQPDDVVHWVNRGLLHHQLGMFRAAISDLTEAIALAPDRFDVWRQRGICHFELINLPSSLSDLTHSLSLVESAQTYNARGNTYRCSNNLLSAIADYQMALSLEPTSQLFAANIDAAQRLQRDWLRSAAVAASDALSQIAQGAQSYLAPESIVLHSNRQRKEVTLEDSPECMCSVDSQEEMDPNLLLRPTANRHRRNAPDRRFDRVQPSSIPPQQPNPAPLTLQLLEQSEGWF